MAPATRTAASMRPLVPFFVPGSLETNSALQPDTSCNSTSAQQPTMVAVRKWDRINGVFVDPQNVPVQEHVSFVPPMEPTTRPLEPVTPPRPSCAEAQPQEKKPMLLTPAAICARRTRKLRTSKPLSTTTSVSSASSSSRDTTPPPQNHLLKRRSMSCSPLLSTSRLPATSTPTKNIHTDISTGSTVTPSTSSEGLLSMAKYAGSTFEAASPAPLDIPIPKLAARRHSLAHSLDAIRVVREPPGGATKRLVLLTPT